jgi:tetratricopeptide (TPR) repeat protein
MTDRGATPARPTSHPATWAVLAVLGSVWSWWAWKQGAFFGGVLYPGIALLCGGAVMLLATAPWRARLGLSKGAAIAAGCLVGLGAWYALSALWSPAPDVAVADGQRVLGYAVAFGLGIWLCNLQGPRMHLALIPLAAAAAFAGAGTVVTLLAGDHPQRYLEGDGTLDFPLGYRNANAAFFLIALWPALGLAMERTLDWRLRAVAAATATLCLELALLGQSRGSIPATAAALLVWLVLAPSRGRALAWLGLVAVCALGVLPAAGDLISLSGERSGAELLADLRAAGRAAAIMAAVAAVLGAAAARLEPRAVALASRAGVDWNRAIARTGAVLAACGMIAFVVAVGNPAGWVGDRVDEFNAGGNPDLSEQSSRFSLTASSNREDLWRVALDAAVDDPLLGEGGGGYRYRYTREREVDYQYARDAHSVGLEVVSELGLPGLVLLGGTLAGALAGALRSRRLGPAAAGLSAVALTSGTYWVVHASLDWFWPYAGLCAPVLALLGSACGPAILGGEDSFPDRRRVLVAGAAALLALSVIPPFLADRYVDTAYREWRADPAAAYLDLDRARTLNPLSDAPLLAEGAIARELGQDERAITAFRRAADKRPEEWASHYLLALLYKDRDPRLAREELAITRELNPLGSRLDSLEHSLGGAGSS